MLADYDFYKNTYKGIVFPDSNSYEYYGERASDELALYSQRSIFSQDATAELQLKKCACRIADILFSSVSGSKSGKKVTSESIAGYYSVSYADVSDQQVKYQINSAIRLYLGQYILGSAKVMW